MAGPYVGPQPVENFYLVRERDRRRARELVLLAFGLAPLALALVAYVWLHVEIRQVGYRIVDQERRLVELQREERGLRMEASALANPERLQAEAAKIGLVTPSIEQMVFVETTP
jgi:hypothetical protein